VNSERLAIERALERGDYREAALMERRFRGQWVEAQMRNQFEHLKWNRRGVDVTGPSGSQYHYEVLSGTESNFMVHGRRMEDVFFRMISF
jgi:hypothetical protein